MLEAAKENKDEMQQKFIELGINRTILPECDWDFRQLAGWFLVVTWGLCIKNILPDLLLYHVVNNRDVMFI